MLFCFFGIRQLHSEVTWSQRALSPVTRRFWNVWEVLHETKSERWPVTGSFVRIMASTTWENDITYLLDVAPNSFLLCPKARFTLDVKVIHEVHRVVGKLKHFRRAQRRTQKSSFMTPSPHSTPLLWVMTLAICGFFPDFKTCFCFQKHAFIFSYLKYTPPYYYNWTFFLLMIM